MAKLGRNQNGLTARGFGLNARYDAGIVKRRLFNLLAAVSLVLCLAMVALWVRSGLVEDDLYHTSMKFRGPSFVQVTTYGAGSGRGAGSHAA